MSEIISPTDFLDESAASAMALCNSFAVPLFRADDRGRPLFVGSGIAFRTTGQAFVLTAAHVLIECNWRPYLLAERRELEPVRATGVAMSLASAAPGTDEDRIDVAAVPLESDEAEALSSAFLSPRHTAPLESDAPVSRYAALGYPDRDQVRDLRRAEYQTAQTYIATSSASQEQYDKMRLHREAHILLVADRRTARGKRATGSLPKLVGMSGCGVWRVNPLETYSEDALPPCVGIIVQKARQHEKLIQVTRFSVVNRLLRMAFPHLDGEIRDASIGGLPVALHRAP